MITLIGLKSSILSVFIILFIFLCFILPASAVAQIKFKLAWDPNLEEDLDGYDIYFREGSPHSAYRMIGDVYVDELADPDNPMVTITDLYNGASVDPDLPAFNIDEMEDGSKYYFALTAFDQQGNVSDLSRDVCVEVSGSSVHGCQADYGNAGGGGGGGGGCLITAAACELPGVNKNSTASFLIGFILIGLAAHKKNRNQ
jgi:hypothetical protein